MRIFIASKKNMDIACFLLNGEHIVFLNFICIVNKFCAVEENTLVRKLPLHLLRDPVRFSLEVPRLYLANYWFQKCRNNVFSQIDESTSGSLYMPINIVEKENLKKLVRQRIDIEDRRVCI